MPPPPPRHRDGGARPPLPSDELGRDAQKYNGLFSEKDWKCPMCSNINWARRSTCNQCQSPKPGSGTDAQREGSGGGFNERDTEIEYRSTRYRAEDDDEYDDFGRRKKKKKANVGTTPDADVPLPAAAQQRVVKSADENSAERKARNDDDEEDDDDDEDDGGKWDAWADVLGEDGKDGDGGRTDEGDHSATKTTSNKDQRRPPSPAKSYGRSRSPYGDKIIIALAIPPRPPPS
ncbi:Zinc finger Ran-binding domain-containing protein 2 [Geranomyces variabilis]|nr:Zinc finger Ran-binding domain-containing protein 2 [Geranomyces variabilis]